MKKTDLYLKPRTYIKSSTTSGEVQGISLENFVVSVLNDFRIQFQAPSTASGTGFKLRSDVYFTELTF